jgi:flagellar basal body-associated protein FliL
MADKEDRDKKLSNFSLVIIIILTVFIVLVIGILIFRYFYIPNSNRSTNALPRLTLDLYDDLEAFMQYDT